MPLARRLLGPALLAVTLGAPACAPSRPPVEPAPHTPATIESKPAERRPAEDLPLAFDRGIWHLEGTLSLPEREEGAKVPAVVIVHGSGPMSRDGVMRGQIGLGFGFELPVYKRLAQALTARGVAVYRYDKRSCGAANGCKDDGFEELPYAMVEPELSTGELIGDAEAALDTVAARAEIDRDRLFFVGHSEGGELVPLLLADRPSVRAGVMLAPPFHTMDVLIEQQSQKLRWSYELAGKPDAAEREGRALHDAAVALRLVAEGTYLGKPILGQPAGLWASWIEAAKRVPDVARSLDRPLLVLGGTYDYNVPPSEVASWGHWLGDSPRAPHRVLVLDCVTHALNCISQSDPSRITPADIGRDVAPEVIAEVGRFLDDQRPPKAPSSSTPR